MKAAALLLGFLTPLLALALPSPVLTHQGRLFDGADRPVDGTVDFTFALYADAAGGTPLWTEARPGTAVRSGAYAIGLGEASPIPGSVFAAESLYLSVKVGTGDELLPRLKLGTVPFAAVAATASDALKLGGLSPDDYLTRLDADATYAKPSDLAAYLKADDADATYARRTDLMPYLKAADADAAYMKTFDLSAYVKASDLARVAFTGQPDGYLKTTDAASTYLSKADAATTYLTPASAASTYLSQSDAASNYLSKTSAASTYLSTANAASTYAPLASPALTGTPTAPTQAASNDSTAVATTAFVKAQGYATATGVATTYAPKDSPTFSGTATFSGAANVQGGLKVGGVSGYVLYDVVEYPISRAALTQNSAWQALWTSPIVTKPAGESWRVEVDLQSMVPVGSWWSFSLVDSYAGTVYAQRSSGVANVNAYNKAPWSHFTSFTLAAGTSLTTTFTLRGFAINYGSYLIVSPNDSDLGLPAGSALPAKLTILKYRTN